MERRNSVPPSQLAAQTVIAFQNAREVFATRPPFVRRTYVATAKQVTSLAEQLSAALSIGAPPDEIDALATRLGALTLEIRQSTIRARIQADR